MNHMAYTRIDKSLSTLLKTLHKLILYIIVALTYFYVACFGNLCSIVQKLKICYSSTQNTTLIPYMRKYNQNI